MSLPIFRRKPLKAMPEPDTKPAEQRTPPWMVRAESDRASGVRELPGAPAHDRIKLAHSLTTLKATSDEIPWCSSIMCLWMHEVGQGYTRSAAARSWLKWGVPLAKPVKGCVVVLWRGGSRKPTDAGPGHVALYVGPGRSGYIKLLGGNQSNAVTIAEFRESDVFGYRWPKHYPIPS